MTGVGNLRTSVKVYFKTSAHVRNCPNTDGAAFPRRLHRTILEKGLMQRLQPNSTQEYLHWLLVACHKTSQENPQQRAVTRNACTLILDIMVV